MPVTPTPEAKKVWRKVHDRHCSMSALEELKKKQENLTV